MARDKQEGTGQAPGARAADGAAAQKPGRKKGASAPTADAARKLNPRAANPLANIFDLKASVEPGRPGPRLALSSAPARVEDSAGLPPVTMVRRFNTSRLLPAKYSESVLTRLADNEDDLQSIFALDNATNERLLTELNQRLGITARELVFNIPHYRIINAAFCHPHPQGGRFSMPYRGSWYAGFDLATAKAEVLFHRMLQFVEISWTQPEELDYDQYVADFCGSFHDLRAEALSREAASAQAVRPVSKFAACLNPESYVASQQLTLLLLEAGSLGIVYPSTRKPGGNCVACFRPSLVCNVRKRDLYRLTWYPDRAATFLRCPRALAAGSV